jgi:hypothetical protein
MFARADSLSFACPFFLIANIQQLWFEISHSLKESINQHTIHSMFEINNNLD